MIELSNEDELYDIIHKNDIKLIFIFMESCPACLNTQDILNKSKMTLSLLVEHLCKINMKFCKDFCKINDISKYPALLLFNKNGLEIARLNFAPDHDDFLTWLTTYLLD